MTGSLQSRRLARIFGGLGVTLLLIALLTLMRVEASTATDTQNSFAWTTHTLEVENVLREYLVEVSTAESGVRGYVVTNDDAYRADYAPAADSLQRLLSDLRTRTSDNPAQQQRLDTLEALTREKLDIMGATVMLVSHGGRDSASRLIKSARGRSIMSALKTTTQHALAAENQLLSRRQATVQQALGRRRAAELLLTGLAFVVLVLAALLWLRVQRAERLITVCAWSKTIHHEGEWMTFEKYMLHRFDLMITHGISPIEADRMLKLQNEG